MVRRWPLHFAIAMLAVVACRSPSAVSGGATVARATQPTSVPAGPSSVIPASQPAPSASSVCEEPITSETAAVTWKTLNAHTGWGEPLAIVPAPQGGAFVAGMLPRNDPKIVPFAAFVGADGKVRWLRDLSAQLPSGEKRPRSWAYGLSPDGHDGVYVLGAGAPFAAVLIRLDSAGKVVWSRPLEGGHALVARPDGVIVAGSVSRVAGAPFSTERDLLVERRDERGNQLWTHRYRLDGPNLYVAADTTAKGFVVAAAASGLVEIGAFHATAKTMVDRRCREDDSACFSPGNMLAVATFADDGTPEWARLLGAPDADVVPNSVRTLPDGSIVVTGGFTGTFPVGSHMVCEDVASRPPRAARMPPDPRPPAECHCEESFWSDLFVATLREDGTPSWGKAFGRGLGRTLVVPDQSDAFILLAMERTSSAPDATTHWSLRRAAVDGTAWSVLTPPPDGRGVVAGGSGDVHYFAGEHVFAGFSLSHRR